MIQLHDLFFKKFISKTQINQAINGIVVKINEDYKDMMSKSTKELDKESKEKYQEAKWLIKSLKERSIAIIRVSRAIMKSQNEFLEKGKLFLKPLVL